MTVVHFTDTYIKSFLYWIATGFSFYFIWKKLGTSINVRYEISTEQFTDVYISKLTLINNKNKPICVWSAHAIIDDKQIILDAFDPPLIIKPLEAIGISLTPFSRLSLDGRIYNLDDVQANIDIYMNTGSKMKKCKPINGINELLRYANRVNVDIYKFDGHTFNKSVTYILWYLVGNKLFTAFIDEGGNIGNEWDFPVNRIVDRIGNAKVVVGEEDIKQFLNRYDFDKIFAEYICYKVEFSSIEIAPPEIKACFRKPPNGGST